MAKSDDKPDVTHTYHDALIEAMAHVSQSKDGKQEFRGKLYSTVALRIEHFRKAFGLELAVVTEPVEVNDTRVVMLAKILDRDDRVLATGYAEETRSNKGVNQTSALENCETSAIGRALANLGLGGGEFASANELNEALAQQEKRNRDPEVDKALAELKRMVEETKGARAIAQLHKAVIQELDVIEGVTPKDRQDIKNAFFRTLIQKGVRECDDLDELRFVYNHLQEAFNEGRVDETHWATLKKKLTERKTQLSAKGDE